MTRRAIVSRLGAMNVKELRFRAACAAHNTADRVRFAIARPAWRRRDLARLLNPAAAPAIALARTAMLRNDALEAHRFLARHFEARPRRWPLAAAARTALSAGIRDRFPTASIDARDRADRIVEGRFDLLGYHDLALGAPPDWHTDAVHQRRARRGFWASIPYIDAAMGDHKVIWELNRHQHFLPLGAAWWLTGRRAYRDTFIAQLEDWLRENPPLDGINWASMLELAFRTLSWTWAVELFCADADADETPWLVDLLVALDRQLAHIDRNLSTYFSPNTHLTGEALALYAVSLAFPELRASATRVARGRDILLHEARAQVLEDGGHAERSSHYHRYSTDFYLLALLVARHTGDAAAPALERAVRLQAEYLRTISDDRGRLPGFGDDDGGQLFCFGGTRAADASSTLAALAATLGDAALAVARPGPEVSWMLGEHPRTAATGTARWPSRLLRASGYFVSRSDRGHLVFDAGQHGFLNGGHAHADALSIVLTVGGLPLLVDRGTATYTMDAVLRDRFRSPAMHNTVTIDGRSFAEPSGPFHWARTADARMVIARVSDEGDFAVGVHTGYGFALARAVLTLPGCGWLIIDALSPARPVTMESWWHLDPAWTAERAEGGFSLTHSLGSTLALATTATDRLLDSNAAHSPEYGRLERACTIRTSLVASGPTIAAAFVPQRAPAGRCPLLTIIGRDTGRDDRWAHWTLGCATEESETRVTVALPSDLETQPPATEWPQPCIQELRASCVE